MGEWARHSDLFECIRITGKHHVCRANAPQSHRHLCVCTICPKTTFYFHFIWRFGKISAPSGTEKTKREWIWFLLCGHNAHTLYINNSCRYCPPVVFHIVNASHWLDQAHLTGVRTGRAPKRNDAPAEVDKLLHDRVQTDRFVFSAARFPIESNWTNIGRRAPFLICCVDSASLHSEVFLATANGSVDAVFGAIKHPTNWITCCNKPRVAYDERPNKLHFSLIETLLRKRFYYYIPISSFSLAPFNVVFVRSAAAAAAT